MRQGLGPSRIANRNKVAMTINKANVRNCAMIGRHALITAMIERNKKTRDTPRPIAWTFEQDSYELLCREAAELGARLDVVQKMILQEQRNNTIQGDDMEFEDEEPEKESPSVRNFAMMPVRQMDVSRRVGGVQKKVMVQAEKAVEENIAFVTQTELPATHPDFSGHRDFPLIALHTDEQIMRPIEGAVHVSKKKFTRDFSGQETFLNLRGKNIKIHIDGLKDIVEGQY